MKSLGSLTVVQNNQVALTSEEKSIAAAYLEKHSTLQNENAAERKLQKVFDGQLKIHKNSMIHDGDVKFRITKIEKPRNLTQNQIDLCKRSLNLASLPGKVSTITDALNRLASQSTTYEPDKMAMSAKVTSYANDLQDLPVDAVLAAINSGWDVWPSLVSLKARAASLAPSRLTMLRIVSNWSPWSKEDEIEDVKSRLDRATFDARYYSIEGAQKNTTQAEKAKEAIPRLEKTLEELTGKKIVKKTAEDVQRAMDDLNANHEQFEKDQAAMKEKLKTFSNDKGKENE